MTLRSMVGASLEVMDVDAHRMRGPRPFVFTCLKTGAGLDEVIKFIVNEGMLPTDPLAAALDTPFSAAPGSTQFSSTSTTRHTL